MLEPVRHNPVVICGRLCKMTVCGQREDCSRTFSANSCNSALRSASVVHSPKGRPQFEHTFRIVKDFISWAGALHSLHRSRMRPVYEPFVPFAAPIGQSRPQSGHGFRRQGNGSCAYSRRWPQRQVRVGSQQSHADREPDHSGRACPER